MLTLDDEDVDTLVLHGGGITALNVCLALLEELVPEGYLLPCDIVVSSGAALALCAFVDTRLRSVSSNAETARWTSMTEDLMNPLQFDVDGPSLISSERILCTCQRAFPSLKTRTLSELATLVGKNVSVMVTRCHGSLTSTVLSSLTHGDVDVIDAVRATIAIPVLLPRHVINGNAYIDGDTIFDTEILPKDAVHIIGERFDAELAGSNSLVTSACAFIRELTSSLRNFNARRVVRTQAKPSLHACVGDDTHAAVGRWTARKFVVT